EPERRLQCPRVGPTKLGRGQRVGFVIYINCVETSSVQERPPILFVDMEDDVPAVPNRDCYQIAGKFRPFLPAEDIPKFIFPSIGNDQRDLPARLAFQFRVDLLVDWRSARMTYDEKVH